MPRKPRFLHPVRQVRNCLGHTQESFAKLIGCSAITVQRIENGSLKLSPRLAERIMDATGALPRSLLRGKSALGMEGQPYSKEAHDAFINLPLNHEVDFQHYVIAAKRYLHLLLMGAHRAPRGKFYACFDSFTRFLKQAADEFDLEKHIDGFLKEQGSALTCIYLVRDLRRFPEYARILGYKDNKRFKPDRQVTFPIAFGWIPKFALLRMVPVLPKDAPKEFREKHYVLDFDRPLPKEIWDYLSSTKMVWRIKEFTPRFANSAPILRLGRSGNRPPDISNVPSAPPR